MRPLIIFFALLLMTAIDSCRSARQTVTQSADSTVVEDTEVKASMSSEEIHSLLNTSTDIDLTGITVEFFPPDTAHPEARAAPKTLKIDNAKARKETNVSKQEVTTASEQDTVKASISKTTASAQATKTDTKILTPLDWVILSTIPITFILLIIAIYITFKKLINGTLQRQTRL